MNRRTDAAERGRASGLDSGNDSHGGIDGGLDAAIHSATATGVEGVEVDGTDECNYCRYGTTVGDNFLDLHLVSTTMQ